MSWTRPQEAVVMTAAALMLAASALLLVVRRPAPPIRIIEAPEGSQLIIQVDGAVARPGVYRLPSTARVADALDAAGGARGDADLGTVNQARPLRDGERISVPHRLAADEAAPPGSRVGEPGEGQALDLNTATAADLEALPGIGPVLARRIIEHRAQRGPFGRIEDLLQVKGVGPRLLEGLRARVVIR